MTRTIALTGGTGFIGQHLIQHLIDQGWRVRTMTRRPPPNEARPQVTWIPGDLQDRPALLELCTEADTLVHCAGAIKAATRSGFYETNETGTQNIMDAAAQMGCSRYVHLSSLVAREPQLSDYASSKRAAEKVVASLGPAVNWTILRPPAVYGPGDRETLKIMRVMTYGIALIPGSASHRTSFIHETDLCRAITACVSSDTLSGETIELRDASPGGYDWHAICAAAGAALGRKVSGIPIPHSVLWPVAALNEGFASITGRAAMMTRGKLRELFHDDWAVNENRLCDTTDWHPQIDLENGFAETFDWYRKAGWL